MKKNFITNLFNFLYKKNVFILLISISIIIGFFSLYAFRYSVKNRISYRLHFVTENIASQITKNLNDFNTVLTSIHAILKTDDFPNPDKFEKIIKHIQNNHQNEGIQSVGYINIHHGKKISANIAMIEPWDFYPSNTADFDLMSKIEDKEAILKAIYSSKTTITRPLKASKKEGSDAQQTLTMFLPFYGSNPVPASKTERLRAVQGIIYIPVRMNSFFEMALGKPDIESEEVNFRLESVDEKFNNPRLVYERFKNKPNSKYRDLTKPIEMYGQKWLLTVTTLPAFYTFTDSNLANILTFVFVLFLVLLTGIFYQTHNFLAQEKQNSIISADSGKVKEAFLSNMSHEIRTPLNAINGFSKILSHTTDESEKKYLVEGIRKNSMELTSFIDNILDISKIEFSKIHINKKNVSLLDLIEKIKTIMEIRAHTKGLLFEIESIGSLPEVIRVDEGRVKQIIINLVGNAIKFTEKGYVKMQIEAQTAANGQTYLLFTVIDTGIGISNEGQLELFQSFSQVDYSNTRKYGGIGLGLALSRRLAAELDGEVILMKSQLAVGSTFGLRVACGKLKNRSWKENLFAPLINPSAQLEFIADLNLNNKKILIVEDQADNQVIFGHYLKSAGAITEIAANGKIALDLVHSNNYDIILMDIQMPVMDGLEATRKIRETGFQNPIIALTAHASVEAKMNCLSAGCIDLITKPVTQETLVQKIIFIIEEKKYAIKDFNS